MANTLDQTIESRSFLAATIESMKDGFSVLDSDGTQLIVNKALCEMTGYTKEELIGCVPPFPYWPDEKHANIEKAFLRVLNGEFDDIELIFKSKNGKRFPVIVSPSCYRDEEGRIKYYNATVKDISESKQFENTLRESEKRLSDAQRVGKIGSFTLDLATGLWSGTDMLYPILGIVEKREYSIQEWVDIIHPDHRDSLATYQLSILDQKIPFDKEYLIVRQSDGETRWVHSLGELQFDDGGNVIGMIGTTQDITERKIAEDEIRQLAAVVENTAESVMVTDADNHIITVNRAFTDITGYTKDEVLGKDPRILQSGKHDRDFYMELSASINTAGVWQGEIWDRRKNGEIFASWQTISVIRDNDGNVINYVSVFSDISSIKRSQEKLDYLAHHDPLTDLPNRLLFNDRLQHALQRARREEHQLAVLFLDLDHFKNINDALGHPVGDVLLKQSAERITQLLRKEDTVARLGGDEFIILIEEIDEIQDVALMAQKIIETFNEAFTNDKHELHLTASIGISLFPQNGKEYDTLVKNADAAMYRAKEEGRNNYQFYTEALTTEAFERLTLETALRHALERDELVLHYQPQYLLETGKLVGVEALIRWQHPDMGLVPPMKFICLAEESGLIVAIGKWVLHTACAQMQCWLDAGFSLKRMAVNLSSMQFQKGDIVETVKSALKESRLSAQQLELEITEGLVMQETERTIELLNKLKDIGVTMAIDDFGTGYSSLAYLKQLPVEKLKIDRSFVRDIPDDPNDEAITRAVIVLGQSLQLEVIAEGIETEAQQEFLKSLGCNEGQGYLYSHPLPAEEFVKLLQKV